MNTKKFIIYVNNNKYIDSQMKKVIMRTILNVEQIELTYDEAISFLKSVFVGIHGITEKDIELIEE